MPYPELEKYREEISRCAMCAGCQADCPTYKATLDESQSARGKLALIEALLKGNLQLSDKFAEKIFQCTSCLNCSKMCPSGVDPSRIINAARSDIVSGKNFHPFISFVLRYIVPSNQRLRFMVRMAGFFLRNLYHWVPAKIMSGLGFSFFKNGKRRRVPEISGSYLKNRFPELVEAKDPVMRVLFFTGCMGDMVNQKASSQIIDYLTENRIEVILPKDLVCCGAPSYYSGERDSAINMAKQNLAVIKKWDPDYVINNCATCGLMLKEVYALLLPADEFSPVAEKIMDIHPFITQKTGLPKSLPAERKIKVTYHDPCHLGRGQGILAEPREILKSIPWVEYIEMDGADLCCGGAGLFSVKYYDLALEIASQKVEAIKKSGAEVVATGCPSCQLHLSDALERAKLDIPVVHTTQLLLKKF